MKLLLNITDDEITGLLLFNVVQTFTNPESWNVVQLSAVDDMLRRVNITLNNVRGERISVNDLTVTGCYDPEGRPTFRPTPLLVTDFD